MRARSFWLILEVVLAFAVPMYLCILMLFTLCARLIDVRISIETSDPVDPIA